MTRWLPVAAAAVAARVVAWLWATPGRALEPTEALVVAANLERGLGFVFVQYDAPYAAWKEPLWIALVALLRRLFGPGDGPVLALQWACGTGVALAVAALALRLLGSRRLALVAGVLAAVNPFLVHYDTRYAHPLSFDVLLFLLLVLAVGRATTEASAGGAAVAGFGCGLALWQRATLLGAAAGAWCAGALAAGRGDRARLVRLGLGSLALAAVLVAPWIARNQVVVGRPLLTSDFAHILWLGNNPLSNGTYGDAGGIRVFDVAPQPFRRTVIGQPEMVQHDVFLDGFRRFVREEPLSYLRLAFARVQGFFWYPPAAGVRHTGWRVTLYRVAYETLLVAGLLGLALRLRRGGREAARTAAPLLGAVLGLAAVHALSALDLKHRVPFEMALCVFAPELLRRRGPR
jgi:hypothetical protein